MTDNTKQGKTGGQDSAWVELEKPKPAPVDDRYAYWLEPPPSRSPRCEYWLRQIGRGWRPNRRIATEGYDNAAEWYGVYIWEFLNAIVPALAGVVSEDGPAHDRVG